MNACQLLFESDGCILYYRYLLTTVGLKTIFSFNKDNSSVCACWILYQIELIQDLFDTRWNFRLIAYYFTENFMINDYFGYFLIEKLVIHLTVMIMNLHVERQLLLEMAFFSILS